MQATVDTGLHSYSHRHGAPTGYIVTVTALSTDVYSHDRSGLMLLRLHWSLIFSSPRIWRRPFLPSSTNKHTNRACARRIPEGNDFAKSDAYTKYDNMLLLGTLFACDWRSICNPITTVGQQGQQGYTNPPPLNSFPPALSVSRARSLSLARAFSATFFL